MVLSSLTVTTTQFSLVIRKFQTTQFISSKGFQNLPSLESLSIEDCPKLAFLPKTSLPPSLLELCITNCPMLKKRCKGKRREWFKIAIYETKQLQ